MKNIKSFILSLALLAVIGIPVVASNATLTAPVKDAKPITADINALSVNPLDLVARPNFYLNKNVKIKAKFDKFAALGLDYKPAMRSSEKYISFLIQRPDVTDHNIPLSELKIFIERSVAEKYIDLNSGDIVEFSGKVFSTALGDPWMDASTFNVISKETKSQDK